VPVCSLFSIGHIAIISPRSVSLEPTVPLYFALFSPISLVFRYLPNLFSLRTSIFSSS